MLSSSPEPSSSVDEGSGTVVEPLRKPGTEETNWAPAGKERNNGSDRFDSALAVNTPPPRVALAETPKFALSVISSPL